MRKDAYQAIVSVILAMLIVSEIFAGLALCAGVLLGGQGASNERFDAVAYPLWFGIVSVVATLVTIEIMAYRYINREEVKTGYLWSLVLVDLIICEVIFGLVVEAIVIRTPDDASPAMPIHIAVLVTAILVALESIVLYKIRRRG